MAGSGPTRCPDPDATPRLRLTGETFVSTAARSILRSAGSLWALFLGLALLMVAQGLQNSLLGVRAEVEGFSSPVTGVVMASYFLGFLAGSRITPALLQRVGHVRVFAAMASLASIAVLVHMLVVTPWMWVLMRLAGGLAYAGLYIVVESWLNDRAANEHRAGLLSLYVMTAYASMAGGQLLLNVADPGTYVLFALVSILISFALVPILLTATGQPAAHDAERFGVRRLLELSPLATVGALLAGMGRGAFFGMGAVFASQAGFSVAEISLFMLLGIAGGALFQWPVGRLSDRTDRRWVIVAMGATTTLTAFGLATLGGPSAFYFGLVVLFGGAMLPLYPLFNAHVNDYLEPRQMVAAGSAMIFLQGVGAIIGPLLAGALMGLFVPAAFLLFVGGMHALMVLFALYRLARTGRRTARRPLVSPAEPVAGPSPTGAAGRTAPASGAAGHRRPRAG